ncbi:MAG: hypothetical protein OHK0038_15410 [Flammeovirgaceae bacterium]
MDVLRFSNNVFGEKLKHLQPEIKREEGEIQWIDASGQKVADCTYDIVGVQYHHLGEPAKFVDWVSKNKFLNLSEDAAWEKAVEIQKNHFKDALFLLEDLRDIHYWFYAIKRFEEKGEQITYIPPTMEEKKDELVNLLKNTLPFYKEEFKYETEKVQFLDAASKFHKSFNSFLEEYQGYDVCMFANYLEDKGVMPYKDALDYLMTINQLEYK